MGRVCQVPNVLAEEGSLAFLFDNYFLNAVIF